jgi:predicted O-methyltransferase YrrM
MLYEMKMARQLVRKEGLISVINRAWRYILKWPRYPLFSFKIRQLQRDKNLDVQELVNFAFTGYDGLVMPLQVRSEIFHVLNILQLKPPKFILEIGTSNGGTLFLLSGVAAADGCIISIDLPFGQYGGGYPAWKRLFFKSFAKTSQIIELIRADSHNPATREIVATILQDNKLDLLFIDGDHTYEGVKKDFEMYEPLVKAGGIIILHDIVPHRQKHGCGVDRYWDEIKRNHEHREFVENPDQQWAGIGMIIKGNREAAGLENPLRF